MSNELMQRNERPAYVQPGPFGSNYGIILTNLTYRRDGMSEGGPAEVALKMADDGVFVVPNVPPVMGGAGGRTTANLEYLSGRVS
jgi:hypothetical protein